jgi:phosphohistidine phosphatase SixA
LQILKLILAMFLMLNYGTLSFSQSNSNHIDSNFRFERMSKILSETIDNLEANVIFLRHAVAPGSGDPENFDLMNCKTQRNLNESGRIQALTLGDFFRSSGVKFDNIFSSAWCRCKETTDLLNLGNWQIFNGLNSFFQGYADKKTTLRLLDEKLLDFSNNELNLLVTHQVVITAVTGEIPPSGGIVIYNSETGASKLISLH